MTKLLQLGVFSFGGDEDRDVRVGTFPEREEVSVGSERPDAGGIGIRALRGSRLQGIGTREAQMRQRSRSAVHDDPAVVENLLKLSGGGVLTRSSASSSLFHPSASTIPLSNA